MEKGKEIKERDRRTKKKTSSLDILDDSDGWETLVADLVNGSHEGELMAEVLLGEDVVHVLSGRGSLKLLSVQHLLLELVKRLSGCDVSLGHLAVTATSAGGNKIGNTARLEEGLVLDIGVKHLGELAHLVESNADDSSLGVITKSMRGKIGEREKNC